MKLSIVNFYIKNRFFIFHQHVFASRFEVCGLCFDRLDQKWYVSTDSNQAVYVSNIFDREKKHFDRGFCARLYVSTDSTLCFTFVFDFMLRLCVRLNVSIWVRLWGLLDYEFSIELWFVFDPPRRNVNRKPRPGSVCHLWDHREILPKLGAPFGPVLRDSSFIVKIQLFFIGTNSFIVQQIDILYYYLICRGKEWMSFFSTKLSPKFDWKGAIFPWLSFTGWQKKFFIQLCELCDNFLRVKQTFEDSEEIFILGMVFSLQTKVNFTSNHFYGIQKVLLLWAKTKKN